MSSGDSASWFMIKKAMFGYGRTDKMGFLGSTFIDKTYLATYICILLFIILSIILYKTRFGLQAALLRREPAGRGLAGHQRLQDALRGHHHLRRAGRHGRLCLRAHHRELHLQRRRRGLRLPGPSGHDLRQLEAAEHRGRRAALRPLQVHRRGLHEHRHKRRRRVPARRAGHQRQLLPHAALPHHPHRPGLHLQEAPAPPRPRAYPTTRQRDKAKRKTAPEQIRGGDFFAFTRPGRRSCRRSRALWCPPHPCAGGLCRAGRGGRPPPGAGGRSCCPRRSSLWRGRGA